jgi:hypothetical protein
MHRVLDDQVKCHAAHRQNLHRCWNHVQVRCELGRQKIFAWLLNELEKCPRHREAFLDAVWCRHEQELRRRRQKLEKISGQILALEKETANLAAAIAAGGKLDALLKQLKSGESKLKKLRKAEAQETCCVREDLTFLSRDEFALRPLLGTLAVARRSSAFAAFLRRLFPQLQIVPVQSLDHRQVRPRARILVALSELNAEADAPAMLQADIDLFDPPLHIKYLAACLAEKVANPKLSLKKLAAKLGIGHMTAKRAVDYAKRMERVGVHDPYVVLTSRPESASRWKERARPKRTAQDDPGSGELSL